MLLNLPEQEMLLFICAKDDQLTYIPTFQKLVTEQFEIYIRVRAGIDPRALTGISPQKQPLRQKDMAPVRNMMLQRGVINSLCWVLTQIPTEGYAQEAGMSMEEYADFDFSACHADDKTRDPVAHWENIRKQQIRMIESIQGHDKVRLLGPNADLTLSIKGRKFNNSFGRHNMPDGEIYTGPVEDSVNGWVKFKYPAIYQGQVVAGAELRFENGRVIDAKAAVGDIFLLTMIDSDEGSHYIG